MMFGIAKLISAVATIIFRHTLGKLATTTTRLVASRATRPMCGTHYRMSRKQRYGGHCNWPALEILCPDGRWRRFTWRTNHSNPLTKDGRRYLAGHRNLSDREELAREALYMSDKFIGPTHFGPDSAQDEGSLRNDAHIGLYVLDPYCKETSAQLGRRWHGRDYCAVLDDPTVDSAWADRLEETSLLPCYDVVAAGLKRPSASRVGAAILASTAMSVTMAILIYYVLFPLLS